jgi:hypothetical protein
MGIYLASPQKDRSYHNSGDQRPDASADCRQRQLCGRRYLFTQGEGGGVDAYLCSAAQKGRGSGSENT